MIRGMEHKGEIVLAEGFLIVPIYSFVNCFRIDKAPNGGSSIQCSIQRMIRSAADQITDIRPIINIVGTARIAMIPKEIANTILGNNLLILPCRFCGSFCVIKVFTVHLHDTRENIIDHHDIVSTAIQF